MAINDHYLAYCCLSMGYKNENNKKDKASLAELTEISRIRTIPSNAKEMGQST
jgi:hypothetical protein